MRQSLAELLQSSIEQASRFALLHHEMQLQALVGLEGERRGALHVEAMEKRWALWAELQRGSCMGSARPLLFSPRYPDPLRDRMSLLGVVAGGVVLVDGGGILPPPPPSLY